MSPEALNSLFYLTVFYFVSALVPGGTSVLKGTLVPQQAHGHLKKFTIEILSSPYLPDVTFSKAHVPTAR
mgnify:CR=1 FL=1